MSVDQTVVDNIHVGPGELVLTRDGTPVTFAATEEGGMLKVTRALEYIEADEVVGRLDAYITGEEAAFEVMCLEQDASLIKESMGHGTITTTAATASVTGKDEFEFGGGSTLYVSALQYKVPRRNNPNLYITIDLYRVVAEVDVEKKYTKKGKTAFRVRFSALNDMSKAAGKRLGKITIETTAPTS